MLRTVRAIRRGSLAASLIFTGACGSDNPPSGAPNLDAGADTAQPVPSPCSYEGQRQACYDGPPGTEGVGVCRAGTQICDGQNFGPCENAILPGDEPCGSTVDLSCDGKLPPAVCPGDLIWRRPFTGINTPTGLAIDGRGNIVAVGQLLRSSDVGAGAFESQGDVGDGYVTSYTGDGKFRWAKQIGGAGSQTLTAVAALPSNEIVLGADAQQGAPIDFGGGPLETVNPYQTGVLGKLDTDGHHVWSKLLTTAAVPPARTGQQHLAAVATTPDGAIFVVGQVFNGSMTFETFTATDDAGLGVAFILKLTSAGTLVWGRSFQATKPPTAYLGGIVVNGISFDGDRLVVAGSLAGTATFDSTTLTSAENSAGAGTTSSDALAFVLASADGAVQWAKIWGGEGNESFDRVQADAHGVGFAGRSNGTLDLGGGVLAGVGSGNADEIIVGRYSTEGAHQWSRRFGGTGLQVVGGLATDSQGGLALCGSDEGTVSFGPGHTLVSGGNNSFFARFQSEDGATTWARTSMSFQCVGLRFADDTHLIALEASHDAALSALVP